MGANRDKPMEGQSFARRRSIVRRGEGKTVATETTNTFMYRRNWGRKQMVPTLGKVQAKTLGEFVALGRHGGEEWLLF
jgi:hypothetical protein